MPNGIKLHIRPLLRISHYALSIKKGPHFRDSLFP